MPKKPMYIHAMQENPNYKSMIMKNGYKMNKDEWGHALHKVIII